MKENTEIAKYLTKINFSLENLFEMLPIGILIFDEKWKIKSVNKNFIMLLDQKIDEKDLLEKSILENISPKITFPFDKVAELSKGKYFESNIQKEKFGFNDIELVIKGSPIFDNGVFKGGTIILEDFRVNKVETAKEQLTFNAFNNFYQHIYILGIFRS